MARPKAPNLLLESGLPTVYPVDGPVLAPPDREGFDVSVRTAVRSLTVMQKEAIVARSGSAVAWRLSSDEGPYLQGHDFAPAPLAYLSTGLAADLLVNVERSLQSGGLSTSPLRITLNSRYTMEGSLARGTMVGGAKPPEITVFTSNSDASARTGAVQSGVMASATAGIVGSALVSTFSLTSHGRQTPTAGVTPLEEPPPDLDERPPRFPLAKNAPIEIVSKIHDVGDDPPDVGSSLGVEQRRELHLQAEVARNAEGLATVEVSIHQPHGSTFRFLSDEPGGLGGQGRAPDALSYISAGIGFCFMTQIGRYAKILQRSVGDYHISQDTRFSIGNPAASPPTGGQADAPRTHVYLEPDDEEFGPHALDMSEQTCFIHAMCRTELRPKIKTLPYR